MHPITIAHISDIHYNPGDTSPVARLLAGKQVLVETLLPACLKILQERNPDILLISGDLTHENDHHAYQYIRAQIRAFLPDTPILCAMGNHDIRHAFRQGFLEETPSDEPYFASCVVQGCLFIALDSSSEDPLAGFLTEQAMDYLAEQLKAHPDLPTFLLMHHPVLRAAKHLGFVMNDRFARILGSGKITALFNGHVHGCYAASVCGVPQFTAESLKTDFDLLPDRISYHDQSGFQIISFDEQGDWVSQRFIQHPKTEIYFEKSF